MRKDFLLFFRWRVGIRFFFLELRIFLYQQFQFVCFLLLKHFLSDAFKMLLRVLRVKVRHHLPLFMACIPQIGPLCIFKLKWLSNCQGCRVILLSVATKHIDVLWGYPSAHVDHPRSDCAFSCCFWWLLILCVTCRRELATKYRPVVSLEPFPDFDPTLKLT